MTAKEQKQKILDMLSSGGLALRDIPELFEAAPAIKKMPITSLLKKMPGSTPDLVDEMIRAFRLRRKSDTSDRRVPMKLSQIPPEKFGALDYAWRQGGLKTSPFQGWPFWDE